MEWVGSYNLAPRFLGKNNHFEAGRSRVDDLEYEEFSSTVETAYCDHFFQTITINRIIRRTGENGTFEL